jgi:hypothetical protein
MPTVWIRSVGSADGARPVFTLNHADRANYSSHDEHITDLIWTPDGQHLVVVGRTDSTPARSRLPWWTSPPWTHPAEVIPRRLTS